LQVRLAPIVLFFLAAQIVEGSCAQSATLTVNSNLVLVPALVKTHGGDRVYSLTARDFTLLDNGIPQTLHLEEDTDHEPLALAVIVQTGGHAAVHLKDYRHFEPILDAVVGSVPHTIGVIGFDSTPRMEHEFTGNTADASQSIATLQPGDDGVAILDALEFGIGQLKALPAHYRRAILLISETFDKSSQSLLDEAVRAVGDTNTTIYCLAFSSSRAEIAHHAAKLPALGGSEYSSTPYAPGGCMSRVPGADPDAHGSRAHQAWDCAGDLLPPLRIAEVAFVAAKADLKQNVPETVAHLTGGEYFVFKDARSLDSRIPTIMNDVPNRYVLSFQPSSPTKGPHALHVTIPTRPELAIQARSSYWLDSEMVRSR